MLTVFQTCNSNSMSEWSCNSRGVSRGALYTHFPFSLPFTPSLHFFPSPSFRSRLPLIQVGCLEERCKLPQRVRVEPGRLTLFGALWAKILLVRAILSIYSRKFTHKFDKFISNKNTYFFSHQRCKHPRKYTTVKQFTVTRKVTHYFL